MRKEDIPEELKPNEKQSLILKYQKKAKTLAKHMSKTVYAGVANEKDFEKAHNLLKQLECIEKTIGLGN